MRKIAVKYMQNCLQDEIVLGPLHREKTKLPRLLIAFISGCGKLDWDERCRRKLFVWEEKTDLIYTGNEGPLCFHFIILVLVLDCSAGRELEEVRRLLQRQK